MNGVNSMASLLNAVTIPEVPIQEKDGCPMPHAKDQRDRQLLHFLAMAVHDLKSPLMIIGNTASLLHQEEFTPQETKQWLERIIRNAGSLDHIIADLTDAIAAQAGQLKLNLDEVDLTELARDVVRDCEAIRKDHPLGFEGDRPCPILGDRERLKRMLLNLLSNAVKYSAAGREVTVSVWQRGARVYLTVLDRGVGIQTADTERLFLPYRRLDCTRDMAEGSGLGLVSVQEIVEAHGGDIGVQGAPGQGTTVEVCFKSRMRDEG